MIDYPAFVFFFNDTATTEIYTLSLHDALPIYPLRSSGHRPIRPDGHAAHREHRRRYPPADGRARHREGLDPRPCRSEEHTSELQSRENLVCRLLLEKKKKKIDKCN